jgi:aspartyl-tRNA(Asn)/glutamyl-tRNA(Gln) amidotransferase subunit A
MTRNRADATTMAELARDFATGKLDPVEHLERIQTAIAACDDPAIFTEMLPERARSEALASRERWRQGKPLSLLDGVPIAWKDLFDIAGRVTTAGSVVRKSLPPAQADARCVAAGAAAGLVSVGVTNMTEFAYSGIGQNPHYGTPRNPNGSGAARAPGGSSSGAAVAVARGLLPVAMGTDTGGSVRAPASFNGIVGYKASTGRYSMDGIFPLSKTLDSLGPLARTVEDCALIDAVLLGHALPLTAPTKGSSRPIIVPETIVFDGCEPAVISNFDRSIARLAEAGVPIERRPMPELAAVIALVGRLGNLLGPEALLLHRDLVNSADATRIDHRVLQRLRSSETVLAIDLVEILQTRARLIAAANASIGEALVAFPTTPIVAMPLAPLEADDATFFRINALTLRNTMLGNFLDWCGTSIPNGTDRDGMPTGFLLSGVHGADDRMLAEAQALEPHIRES